MTGQVFMTTAPRHFLFKSGNDFILVQTTNALPAAGDTIICHGRIKATPSGYLRIASQKTVVLNHGTTPQPRDIPVDDMEYAAKPNEAIRTEGTLLMVRPDEIDSRYVLLVIKGKESLLNVSSCSVNFKFESLRRLLGARVRISGYWHPYHRGQRRFFRSFVLADESEFTILSPAPPDPFAVPELDCSDTLSSINSGNGMPLRVSGRVIATWNGENILVKDDHNNLIGATLAEASKLPDIDKDIVLSGYPESDLFKINLMYAQWKPNAPSSISHAPQIKSQPITLTKLFSDSNGRRRINPFCHGELLSVEATTLEVHLQESTLLIEDKGYVIPVDFSADQSTLSRIEIGSRVRLEAIAILETDTLRRNLIMPKTRGITLIRRPGDAFVVVSKPTWWTKTRLTIIIAVLGMLLLAQWSFSRLALRLKINERTRLAIELHDSLSQNLTGLACQISSIANILPPDQSEVKSRLEIVDHMLSSCRSELRFCLQDLRSNAISDPDFAHAIRASLSSFANEAEIVIRFHVSRRLLSDTLAHAVICIIRELCANAITHGCAASIQIAGTIDKSVLRFSVRNDGSVFDPLQAPGPREGHFGLRGIRERVFSLGGEFRITPNHPCGMKATVSLPIQKPVKSHD